MSIALFLMGNNIRFWLFVLFSTGNSSGLYNDENFTSGQGGEYNDGQRSPVAEDTTIYFNYQTYMDRTPSARWSKQDTELFYEVCLPGTCTYLYKDGENQF